MAWVPLTHLNLLFVYLILNRLSQFAVPPSFLQAASCFRISMGRLSKYDHRKLKTFYRKRFVRIIPPYLIWTLVYLVVKHIESNGTVLVTLGTILTSFLRVMVLPSLLRYRYTASVHILTFHNVRNVTLKHKISLRPLMLCRNTSSLLLLLRELSHTLFSQRHTPHDLVLSLCTHGVWIGINYETYCKKDRYITAFVPIAIVSGISYTYLYHLSNISQHVPLGRLNLVWYIYVSSMPLLLLYISKKVNSRFFETAGQLSFGIFLMHPLFLFIMNRIYATANAILYDIFVFFIIYSLSYIITKWLEATPWANTS